MSAEEHSPPPDQRALSAEEVARRGDAIYAQTIRAHLEPAHEGEIVAIDVLSGDYAVAEDALAAVQDLRTRRPDAEVWLMRVGSWVLDRIGALADPGDR
jgi:hypothetical protein